MNRKSLALALASGIASFLVVGIAVTALAEPRIEFSVLLGIPAGLAAGAFATAAVYLGLGDDSPARRRIAVAFALFGVGFLGALVVTAAVGLGLTIALLVGIVVGVATAVGYYLRGRKSTPTTPS